MPSTKSQPIPAPAVSANLDLLRAIAVLCVFTNHLLDTVTRLRWGSLGRFGVILFFVHTSLVLMYSLDRMQHATETDSRLTVAFWLRRIFRIYPLALLTVLVVILFHIPLRPHGTYTWIGLKGFVSNLALTQNLTASRGVLGVLWSLPLEVQMYVLLPFAYLICRNTRYRSLALWILSIPAGIYVFRLNWRLDVFHYAPCFASGIVAYDLSRAHPRFARLLPAWIWPIGIFAAIVLFGPRDDMGLGVKLPRAWILSLAVAVLWVAVKESSPSPLTAVAHWIADRSYGIYLSHTILFWLFLHKLAIYSIWLRVPALALTCVLVPALLYRYVERPLMLVGNHISRRILHPTLSSEPPAKPTGAVPV